MDFVTNSGHNRKGPRSRGLFLFLALTILLFSGVLIKSHMSVPLLRLSITRAADGATVMAVPVAEGEFFQIKYIHSVDQLPVQETFVVRDGKMVLDQAQWLSFGAGLGYTGQGEIVLDGEWTKIVNLNRAADPLLLRVGTIARHCLIYRGEEFYLRDYVDGMTLVSFSVVDSK